MTPDINQLKIDRSSTPTVKPRYPLWWGLPLVIAVTAATAWQRGAEKVMTDAPKVQAAVVAAPELAPEAAVGAGNLPLVEDAEQPVLDASGYVVARRIATVSSRVTGKVLALHIEEGQQIAKGQVMAELDDQQASISYGLAEAELAANEAALEELAVAYGFQQQTAQRHRELAVAALISQQQADDSQRQLRQLAAQRGNRQARVALARQQLALAAYQLAQHKIRAPFDGVVISKNAQVGELMSAGAASGGFIRTGVGTLVDMDSLEIEVEIGERYIQRVHTGQPVVARLDAYPDWAIDSEVLAIIPTADRQKGSIKVRIRLLQRDPRILPDMGVKVSFFNPRQEA